MRSRTPAPLSPKDSGGSSAGTMPVEANTLGDIRIHEDVIASIARNSALAVEGVSRLAGSALIDNIAGLVGSRRMQSRAIAIEIDDNNRIALELKLILKAGYSIPEVAGKVQQAVIEGIESVTGMTVLAVHVLVQEIDGPEAAEQKPEENGIPFN